MFAKDQGVIAVDRCVFELRQGRAVIITDRAANLLVSSLEHFGEPTRRTLEAVAPGEVDLLLTAFRARALGLSASSVRLQVSPDMSHEVLVRLAYGRPNEGDRALAQRLAVGISEDKLAEAGFYLCRLAETMPALLAVRTSPQTALAFAGLRASGSVLATSVDALAEFKRANVDTVRRLSTAPVPLPDLKDTKFVAYRSRDSLTDHVAVVIGSPDPEAPLVRLHSACLTGDVFRSLRCDCGEQLDKAIAAMREADGGIICYLAQEGRGIGIANKLRAYALQDGGMDTLEANEALGFAADEREFAIAARMLDDLGYGRVRLITNNPEKIGRLESSGIVVTERVPLKATLNPHNERYINARVHKTGYLHAVNG